MRVHPDEEQKKDNASGCHLGQGISSRNKIGPYNHLDPVGCLVDESEFVSHFCDLRWCDIEVRQGPDILIQQVHGMVDIDKYKPVLPQPAANCPMQVTQVYPEYFCRCFIGERKKGQSLYNALSAAARSSPTFSPSLKSVKGHDCDEED